MFCKTGSDIPSSKLLLEIPILGDVKGNPKAAEKKKSKKNFNV